MIGALIWTGFGLVGLAAAGSIVGTWWRHRAAWYHLEKERNRYVD